MLPARLILASHNPGKLKELRRLVAGWPLECLAAGELGLSPSPETSESFLGNAKLKAEAVSSELGAMALGDDGGLVVPKLGGLPGVHSSRWVEEQGGWVRARERLCGRAGLLGNAAEPVKAYLVCALAFAGPGGQEGAAEARIDGELRWPPVAKHEDYGPGFLPIFAPQSPEIWMDGVLRHRRTAFESLSSALRNALASG